MASVCFLSCYILSPPLFLSIWLLEYQVSPLRGRKDMLLGDFWCQTYKIPPRKRTHASDDTGFVQLME